LFAAGKNREGYFSSFHVCKQIRHAMDILAEHYTGEDHIFIFDNSPKHVKRGADAPSARQMPKFTPKPTSKNFLVETTDDDGNKVKVPMTGGYFRNGEPQLFYWPEDHLRAGWFKGMAEILKERGWENAYQIKADCKSHDLARTGCCLRRILFNEPDFAGPTSMLERLVTSRGYGFLLLPKFHPELNPIEQCWGKAKRVYREFPESTGAHQLENFVVKALDSVSLEDIRK
jgi:transposase